MSVVGLRTKPLPLAKQRWRCCVCFEDAAKFEDITECFHMICNPCLKQLLDPLCPLCRGPLPIKAKRKKQVELSHDDLREILTIHLQNNLEIIQARNRRTYNLDDRERNEIVEGFMLISAALMPTLVPTPNLFSLYVFNRIVQGNTFSIDEFVNQIFNTIPDSR